MVTQRILVLLMLMSFGPPALADDLIGQASVIDGDTLEIHERNFEKAYASKQLSFSRGERIITEAVDQKEQFAQWSPRPAAAKLRMNSPSAKLIP